MHKLWTSDLDTGIPEIDAENRKIVNYINILSTAKSSGDREELGKVLDNLLDYVCSHFIFEEHMMQQANYEYRVGHEKVHEIFAKNWPTSEAYNDGETRSMSLRCYLLVDDHIVRRRHVCRSFRIISRRW